MSLGEFLGNLLYTLLSLTFILSMVTPVVWFVRSRMSKGRLAIPERLFYILLTGGSLLVWFWSGLRPATLIADDRIGLYWGVKTDHADWTLFRSKDDGDGRVYTGTSSVRVTFEEERGWVIFHHFPTAPPRNRYEAIEFYVNLGDLEHDSLLVSLIGDGKVYHPTKDGITVSDAHFCDGDNPDSTWRCVRIQITEFNLKKGGIIGIAIGKSAGEDVGSFYLDRVRLIEK